MSRTEFRFSGFGGQGVITMAHVLGHGASVYADMAATMTEAYGPEKTGGFSRGDVVVSDEAIDYPAVIEPDVVVAFSQDAFERDADSVTDSGRVLVEADLVDAEATLDDRPDVTLHRMPAVEAAEELGRKVVANIVMLGAVMDLVQRPDIDAVKGAIVETVPDGTEELNERAFEKGASGLETAEVIA
jgi:2-oxoglutarate ferredoxin oxidoreductase subunit gamma